MQSMTGYGRGGCLVGGRRLVVEIRAVNHRFFDLKQRWPWSDAVAETLLATAVRRTVERGAVTVQVRDQSGTPSVPSVSVNLPLARRYFAALEELRQDLGLRDPVPLGLLTEQRDVIVVGEAELEGEALWQALEPAVMTALEELGSTRRREGEAIAADLRSRNRQLERLCDEIATLAAASPVELRARLSERLARLGGAEAIDPARLAQEAAILADRIDITEELTRLRCHVAELQRLLGEEGAVGRRLDFLLQEMGREVNTMAAKAQSAEISLRVVAAKAELEKMREQVQNVE